MNLVIIWAIAANCFQETIRDRVLYSLAFYGLLLACGSKVAVISV